jgi:hypothetical protein
MNSLWQLTCYFFLAAVVVGSPFPLPIPQSKDGSGTPELIGDLRFKQSTPVGIAIAGILLGTESAQSNVIGTAPTPKKCKTSKDPCCIWYEVSKELVPDFLGRTGLCNNNARAAIRLGFHDAGTWSKSKAAAGEDFGGADGSLALFGEISRGENRGLESIVQRAIRLQKKFGVSMADLIQYMAIHATVICPLGPRIRMFVGRKDATRAAPDGLLPDVRGDADSLIKLFEDKTISPHMLTALLGAHSTSKQRFVDSTKANQPQDKTPGVWDVKFYNETLQANAEKRTFRFPSDGVLAQDPRMSDEWKSFVGSQSHWNEDYATAYTRLSLLGVNNINELQECTVTLPAARPSFGGFMEGDPDE